MADIIDIRTRQVRELPLCGNCVNAALSTFGVHCLLYKIDILDETEAVDCDEFESLVVQSNVHPSMERG